MTGYIVTPELVLSFGTILLILLLVFLLTNKKPPKKREKIFACGEDMAPEEFAVPESGLFKTFNQALRTERLSRLHSGDLTRYLVWLFLGMLFVVMYLLWVM